MAPLITVIAKSTGKSCVCVWTISSKLTFQTKQECLVVNTKAASLLPFYATESLNKYGFIRLLVQDDNSARLGSTQQFNLIAHMQIHFSILLLLLLNLLPAFFSSLSQSALKSEAKEAIWVAITTTISNNKKLMIFTERYSH